MRQTLTTSSTSQVTTTSKLIISRSSVAPSEFWVAWSSMEVHRDMIQKTLGICNDDHS